MATGSWEGERRSDERVIMAGQYNLAEPFKQALLAGDPPDWLKQERTA